MNIAAIVAALALPPDARVDQPVPKKLLVEQGSPTAADKRRIQGGVEELQWIAALKPTNIGVPPYRDGIRDYSEIAVLSVTLGPKAGTPRLIELIHRAIPDPVLLLATDQVATGLSLAHKRLAQGRGALTVVDGPLFTTPLGAPISESPSDLETRFLESLALAAQPRAHLRALYEGWIDCVEALQYAGITGLFIRGLPFGAVAIRRLIIGEYDRSQKKLARLRAQAAKETQLNRRVEINLKIRHLETKLARNLSNPPGGEP
jgi:hypothetical protein